MNRRGFLRAAGTAVAAAVVAPLLPRVTAPRAVRVVVPAGYRYAGVELRRVPSVRWVD